MDDMFFKVASQSAVLALSPNFADGILRHIRVSSACFNKEIRFLILPVSAVEDAKIRAKKIIVKRLANFNGWTNGSSIEHFLRNSI